MAIQLPANGVGTVVDTATVAARDRQVVVIGDPLASNEASVSDGGRLRTGSDSLMFFDGVEGNTLNHNLWNTATTTMTVAQASNYIVLNNNNTTTANTDARVTSHKAMPYYAHFPLSTHFKVKPLGGLIANTTMEVGFGTATARNTPTDGAFFRWKSDGTFVAVVNNGGNENTINLTPPTDNDNHTFEITIYHQRAVFQIDGGTPATVDYSTVPMGWSNTRQPFFARVYTGTSASAQPAQLYISEVAVAQTELTWTKSWDDQSASAIGLASYDKPAFATDWASTAVWSNTAQATASTLTNTTIPQTWQGGLGGDYAFTQPGTSATDLILFAYQVPAGFQLYIKHIYISQFVVTGAIGGAGISQQYFACGINSSALSLATAESPPTTWSRRVVPLGMTSMVATPALGTVSPQIPADVTFPVPLVVDGGRYFHIMFKNLGGTATAGSIWRGICRINGYFE